MAAGDLLHLWNQWGIQILVLTSFVLQVFLLVVGGIRRRSSSTFLRIALWFAYLLADSTAIYTLGHLSVSSSSREHQLVPFWAPFLLLHLGGPDNVTAYSLEDNSLWLRHLQVLTVQVLGAAYVIYRYMPSGGTLLLLASISMFVAGLAKYGERTWALKSSNISSIRSSLSYLHYQDNPCQFLRQDMSEEEILLLAHRHFDICKCVFTDFPIGIPRGKHDSPIKYAMNQYKLVEMELSLMYDVLYTKAAVIHTWYGFCIHFISFLASATAFLLFQLSISIKENGYSRVDVIVSYVLLVGALVLETVSLFRTLLSSWTRSILQCKGKRWEWLFHAITFLRRHVQPASRRLWAGSIGQYNLFHLCIRDSNKLGSRLAVKMGIEHWWNKMHFSGTFLSTDSLSTKDLIDMVFRAVPELSLSSRDVNDWDPTGRSIMIIRGLLTYLDPMIFGVDFNESILTWHIVTEMYIHSKAEHEEQILPRTAKAEYHNKLIEAIQVLSNYLMFLMVVKPDMLPNPRPQNAHVDLCNRLDGRSRPYSFADETVSPVVPFHRRWNPFYMLKELFHRDGPNRSRITQRKKLIEILRKGSEDFKSLDEPGTKKLRSFYAASMLRRHACQIVHSLTEKTEELSDYTGEKKEELSDMLEVLFAVWVELLLYAGEHCSRESHARHLSNGCEFITILWLMMRHQNYYPALCWESKTLRTSEQDVS